ncbi:MAG: (d)CMP kinase [archaeon]
MRIALSGPPGSGKTTVGEIIAKRLSLKFIPASQIFREMAKEQGMPIEQFNKFCETDKAFDKKMDASQKKYMLQDNVVIDSRLSAHFITNADFKVHIRADLKERARRVAGRDKMPPAEAEKKITAREASERARYTEYYGIDITDLSIYDIVLNSTKWTADEVADIIVTAIRQKEVKK